ncbi:MAG: ATP-binding protein [Chloroflexota bacterium]
MPVADAPLATDAVTLGPATEPGFFVRLHRARMVEIGTLLSALASLLFGAAYYLGGAPIFVQVNAIGAAGFLVVGFARPFSLVLRLYAAITVGLLLFGVQLAFVADIDNGITPWLLVPPIAAVIMGERRMAVYAATLAIAEPAIVVLAANSGLLLPRASVPFPEALMLASLVGVLGICATFAWISSTTRNALQHAVDARNAALASALAAAQGAVEDAIAAAEAKDAFFANLTHEIRTPLTGIAGTAELLAQTPLSTEGRHLADALLASTRSLTALVNAMLDHARLAAGHAAVDVAPVAPREIAADIDSLYRPAAEERGLDFVVAVAGEVPDAIASDRIRLQQVLANLVANALKFTARGEVRVGLDWEPGRETGDGTLILSVADTGPGIAPEQRDRIFEPFVQGDASIRRTYGGTGLGLAISRQLTDLMGGTLTLATEVGAGSTFTVRIPVALADLPVWPQAVPGPPVRSRATTPADVLELPAAAPAAASADDNPLDGLRVLLVEDNDGNRRVATAMLRRMGVEVLGASDGHEALALVASAPVDLVLMDLQMPGMDGIEATRQIRAAEVANGSARLPIVAMTGNALEDYGEACEAAGMDAFVTKPVSAAQLREVVSRALASAPRED